MHPAFSVIFLTTLIGAGQGLFIALYCTEAGARFGWLQGPDHGFYVGGAIIVCILMGLGLIASFFHLGRPERGWRAAARWRTSWLSREVIVLPAFFAGAAAWAALHWLAAGDATVWGPVPSTLVVGDSVYHIYCTVCHGPAGASDGPVSPKIGAPSLLTPTWFWSTPVRPSNRTAGSSG